MKKITFAVLGMGNRGTVYAGMQLRYPEEMKVTAMADVRPERLEAANKYLELPKDRIFDSAQALFAQPRLADILVISTQDAQHREHALEAMELGYDLLLEKPISNKLEDVVEIANVAKRLGRKVIVCHVLRYAPFYQQVKKLLQSGTIGKIRSLEAAEWVGYYHYAHSFVRGKWHRKDVACPMILAKCCHDMDIIYWLLDQNCEKISSFGSLDHFTAKNLPEGAAERCEDCALECPYHAQRFYLPRVPKWPTNVIHPEPTVENITELLKTTDFGRCVYRMDNDVVDHQTVNMRMADGATVTFQMNGFANADTRTIHVVGTEGELYGNFRTKELWWQRFGQPRQDVDVALLGTETRGHGGGDAGLIRDVIRFYRGDEDFDASAVTLIERSVESHFMSFAAEESRLLDGQPISMNEFKRQIGAE